MNTQQYKDWCEQTGYITATDWQYQTIGVLSYWFLLNPKTDKFALIQYNKARVGTGYPDQYEVFVQGWTDYNGWAEKFHNETGGLWK